MSAVIRVTDNQGRISLPGFANTKVILEPISASEYRVRKADMVPADELHFTEEELPLELSKRDARQVIKSLEKPPRPKAAARRAAKRLKKDHG